MTETPSIALGTSEVSLLELTGAYAPFANGGYGVIPHVIKRIATVDGDVLYERSGSGPGRVVDPDHVGMMNAMLEQTLAIGTETRRHAGWPLPANRHQPISRRLAHRLHRRPCRRCLVRQ
jgi:penicillin-binding protein 1A